MCSKWMGDMRCGALGEWAVVFSFFGVWCLVFVHEAHGCMETVFVTMMIAYVGIEVLPAWAPEFSKDQWRVHR